MQMAIAGKGGSGKTTISATLARLLARRQHRVLAIDGDSNPNLAVALGVPTDVAWNIDGLPHGLLKVQTDDTGLRRTVLTRSPAELFEEFGVDAPDGVRLLVASKIDHAGTG